MLEILAHADLAHQLVLVAIHSSQLADVRKRVLETISELIGVNVAQAVLDMGVHHELGEAENFSDEMEGIAESGLLALLGRQRLDRLEVEVEVEMEVVEVLSVNEKIEHVVALATDLQTDLHPVKNWKTDKYTIETCDIKPVD